MSGKPKEEDPSTSLLLERLMSGGFPNLQEQLREALLTFTEKNAVFKTKVQRGGRISIPEAERDVLGIDEGDIVQVILAPVKKKT
ncbi:AbrB/MazE/SpoVT family DNA-binding domain-containing protein [Candidatus Bathyarchaeota archaeon]|nr:AbrB/MazE/SpoVT family DNA-binding domain-containing protein [Candidatus Bathyarchaeota archaeon]